MRTIFVVLVLVALGQALPNYEEFRQEWNSFKSQHSKTYKDVVEDLKRLKIYLQTKEKILKHNKLYEQGKSTYYMALNHFADMTPEELKQMMPPFNRTKFEAEGVPYSSLSSAKMPGRPDSMDWRWSGAVTRVKNQGGCGSCWTFATTGALETRNWRKTGHLVDLSEQNLLDCSRPWGTNGCGGGWPHDAFRYVIDNRGIDNEWSYPYEARENNCRFNQYNVGATAGSYAFIQQGNENQMADAVYNEGPIAIAFDCNHDSIMYYGGGVVHENNCNPNVMAHAVTLVGYGYDPHGGDYWLIKNSWGEGYGEGGYLRLARNKNNMCGVATVSSFPLN